MINFTKFEGNASTTYRTAIDAGNAYTKTTMCTLSVVAIVLGLPDNILVIHESRCRMLETTSSWVSREQTL